MYIDNILAHTEGTATGLAINYATGNFDSMLVCCKRIILTKVHSSCKKLTIDGYAQF